MLFDKHKAHILRFFSSNYEIWNYMLLQKPFKAALKITLHTQLHFIMQTWIATLHYQTCNQVLSFHLDVIVYVVQKKENCKIMKSFKFSVFSMVNALERHNQSSHCISHCQSYDFHI